MNLDTGDIVWIVERDENDAPCEVSGFVFVAANEECVICSAEPWGYDGTISEYLMEESAEMDGVSVYVFPIGDAFYTQDEAHEALRV